MKKYCLLLLSLVCFSTTIGYSAAPCNSEKGYYQTKPACPASKPACPVTKTPSTTPCEKTYNTKPCEKAQTPCQKPCETKKVACPSGCFLCTNKDAQLMYKRVGLSNSQICTAEKIQSKYELETLSINERLNEEYENKASLKNSGCVDKKELRCTRRTIKDLKKQRKKICECYEDQFEAILSCEQKRAYRRYKRK